jgi:hypothetical protein
MEIWIGTCVTEWPCSEAVLNKFPIIKHHFAGSCVERVNNKFCGSNVNMCEILRIHSCVKIVLKLFLSDTVIKVEGRREEATTEKIVQLFLDREKMKKKTNKRLENPQNIRFNKCVCTQFLSIYLHYLYLCFPPVWYLPPNVIEF